MNIAGFQGFVLFCFVFHWSDFAPNRPQAILRESMLVQFIGGCMHDLVLMIYTIVCE